MFMAAGLFFTGVILLFVALIIIANDNELE